MKTKSILSITFIYLAFLAFTVAMTYPMVKHNSEKVKQGIERVVNGKGSNF